MSLKAGPTARRMISEAKGKSRRPQIFSSGFEITVNYAYSWQGATGPVCSFRWGSTSFPSSLVMLGPHLHDSLVRTTLQQAESL